MKRFAFVSIVLSVLVGNAAIASFVPQPNQPPVRTGGTSTRYRELPPRRIDPASDPRIVGLIAQSAIHKQCSTKNQIETCKVYRINRDRSLTLLYTSVYNKKTQQIRVIQAQQPKQASTPVTDPKHCGDRVAVVDENGQIVCVDVEAVKPAPGCIVMGSPTRPIVTCKPLVATTDDSKSVPESEQTPIYPGLPPAPQKPSEVETAYRGSGRAVCNPNNPEKCPVDPESQSQAS